MPLDALAPAPSPLACYEQSPAPHPAAVLTVGGVDVFRVGAALRYVAGLAVDADGAPDAYHPSGHPPGRDALANAGHPGRWYGVVTDSGKPDGMPVVQEPSDPCPGFYVSPTAFGDRARREDDPRRYVDAGRVPYVSIPPELRALGVRMGDACQVRYRGQCVAAIVAEVGPHGKLGEGSIALALALGLDGSPIHGGCGSGVEVTIWPGSTHPWPRLVEDINAQVAQLASV